MHFSPFPHVTPQNQRQDRALINLRELSESPWNIHEDTQNNSASIAPYIDSDIVNIANIAYIRQQKTYTNTIESVELPLRPKQKSPVSSPKRKENSKNSIGMNQNNSPKNQNNKALYQNNNNNISNGDYSPTTITRRKLASIVDRRPHTIHNHSLNLDERERQSSKNCSCQHHGHNDSKHNNDNTHKKLPLTSLNFYDAFGRTYNTFDDRTRLNQQIEIYASRIRHQQRLMKSIDQHRSGRSGNSVRHNNNSGNSGNKNNKKSKSRSSNIYNNTIASSHPTNQDPTSNNGSKIHYKLNVAKRSFFYKQFKNFLYQSFKVDGKPVSIQRDRYSIQPHGLPKKKSIYSFKQRIKQEKQLELVNKTDILLKHNNKGSKRYGNANLNKLILDDDNLMQHSVDNQTINIDEIKSYKKLSVQNKDQNKKVIKMFDNINKNDNLCHSYMSQTVNILKGGSNTGSKEKSQRQKQRQKQRLRQIIQMQKKTIKGKLWLGRPPKKIVVED